MVEVAQVNGDIFYLTAYYIKKSSPSAFLKKLSAISCLNCEAHELNVSEQSHYKVSPAYEIADGVYCYSDT